MGSGQFGPRTSIQDLTPSSLETPIAFLTRLLFAIYFIETGLLLIVGPWTEWWSRNLFAQLLPWLQLVMASSLTRLAVNVLAGHIDIDTFRGHRQQLAG